MLKQGLIYQACIPSPLWHFLDIFFCLVCDSLKKIEGKLGFLRTSLHR